nr:MAG TPA: hypothetical protein [Bacteriophage sp.]
MIVFGMPGISGVLSGSRFFIFLILLYAEKQCNF